MSSKELQYLDTAISGYKSRNTPKSVTWLVNYFKAINLGQATNLSNVFIGQYRFGEELIDYVAKNSTISGFVGSHISDTILTDTDEKDSVLDSIPKLKNLIEHLESFGLSLFENLLVRTTGHKGFNLVVPAGVIGYEAKDNFAAVAYRFIELLFPNEGRTKGWLNYYHKEQGENNRQANTLKHVDQSIYGDQARLHRVACTKNQPKSVEDDDGQPYGYCLFLSKDELETIFREPKAIYSIWKKPNNYNVTNDFIDGSYYWNYKPVPKLQELWEKAIQTVGQTKAKVFYQSGTGFNPLGVRAPACIKEIWKLVVEHGGMDKSGKTDLLAGNRNNTFEAILPWLYQSFPDQTFFQASVRYLNSKLSKQISESDLNSMLATYEKNKYGFACGHDSNMGKVLQGFCGKSCGKAKRSWLYGDEAYDKMNAFWAQGDSLCTTGIGFWDELYHGHYPGQVVCLQSFPGVGKTSFLGRIFRHQVPIAKSQGKICVFSTPEENQEIIATYLAMQQGELTLKRVKEEVKLYGGVNGKVAEFKNAYGRNYMIDYIRGKRPSQIRDSLESMRQQSGMDFFSIALDSMTFIKPDNDNLTGAARAESVANAMEDLAAEFNTTIFMSIHLPKFEAYSKMGKKSKRVTDQRPSLIAAKGSVDWAGLVSHLFSVYTRSDKVVMLAPEKGRLREEGQPLPPPQPFVRTGHYMLYSTEEAQKIYGDKAGEIFGLDFYELETIAKHGEVEDVENEG